MTTTRTIYERLTSEAEAPSDDIASKARRETPRNFVLILLAQIMTKLGDAVANPKTVLAWIMAGVGAPVALTGLLVPIRESGSLIPQLVIASWVSRLAIRKWVWIAGSAVQAASVAGMGAAALSLEGPVAGWTIVALLAVFSAARSFCSVSAKDVLGKTVPKSRRGQLTGWAASGAGLASLLVGLALLAPFAGDAGPSLYGALLFGAGLLWLGGAAVYTRVVEFRGETDEDRAALAEAWQRLTLLVTDAPFRRFVIARALLLCSALSAPYYVVLARQAGGERASVLGLFVLAGGLASLLAAPVWGRLADRSSRRVMASAALTSGLIGVVVFGVVTFVPGSAANTAFLPLAFFVLGVAHQGVRVGRKTYVVDLAEGNRRTDYVAVSNTVIGIVLLVAGSAGALASAVSVTGIVLALSCLGLAGAFLAARLPEVSRPAD